MLLMIIALLVFIVTYLCIITEWVNKMLAALIGGFVVYGILKATLGIRLSQEDEYRGADLSIHKISANSEESMF